MAIQQRMPRMLSRDLFTERVGNTLSEEIDNLGVAVKVRRTTTYPFVADTPLLLGWEAVSFNTRGDMADLDAAPTQIRIRVPGTYRVALQVRFSGTGGGSGSGIRYAYILKNGTSPGDVVTGDQLPGIGAGEGVTLRCSRTVRGRTNDVFYAYVGSSATVTGAHLDFGGTSFSLTRKGPLGGAL